MEWIYLTPTNHSQLDKPDLFTQLRIAILKFFHTISWTMLGMMKCGTTLLSMRRPGMNLLQMVWICLIPINHFQREELDQFIQLRTATLKFFHTTNQTMPGMMRCGTTHHLMRRRGMSLLQMEWICLTPTNHSQLDKPDLFTQLRIATLKFFHTINWIMPGMMRCGTTLLSMRRHGTSLHQMEWIYLTPTKHSRSKNINKVNFNS